MLHIPHPNVLYVCVLTSVCVVLSYQTFTSFPLIGGKNNKLQHSETKRRNLLINITTINTDAVRGGELPFVD